MRITFLLPGAGRFPVGGLKIVYEYANRLASKGHVVSLVHAANVDREADFHLWLQGVSRYVKRRIRKDYGPAKWFELDENVKLAWVPDLAPKHLPHADAVIATSWRTAEWMGRYSHRHGKQFYFLQHLETWSGPEDRVMATWKLPLHKSAISRWLQSIAEEAGETAEYIPNGLDFDRFGMDLPASERDPCSVMMLYHADDWKGSADGIEALMMARKKIPGLKATLFGVPHGDAGFPDWITYHQQPAQKLLRKLYNESAIFLAPSWAEGWGLTASEAMMCGCAVVATDIGGHREFAKHEETSLMVPPHDPEALAQQVVRIARDNDLRMRLSRNGNAYIQRFTWESSVHEFEKFLLDVAGRVNAGPEAAPGTLNG